MQELKNRLFALSKDLPGDRTPPFRSSAGTPA
jgi:hypothetical protein